MKTSHDMTDPYEVAHAIRNQLGLISGHASLLKMSPGINDGDRESLEKISAAVFEISNQVSLLATLFDKED